MRSPLLLTLIATTCNLVGGMPSSKAAPPLVVEAVVLRPLAEAEVPARQLGVVQKIAVAEGQRVAAGDLLVQLDAISAALVVERTESERDQARAKAENTLPVDYADKALEVARAELARSEESIAKFAKSISRSQLDVERLTVEKLLLERRQAEHDLRLAKFDWQAKDAALAVVRRELELHAVRAPFAGVVTLVRARQGEWVEPGAAVLRLIAVDKLRAEGFVDAADARAAVGAPVQFVPGDAGSAAPESSYGGRLHFVSPEIDPVTRQVRVWAELDNPAGALRPGQQGRLVVPDDGES
ncbi:MAG: efflux RND transporter periplasmic adaptor subunit [Pirellulales bacterium]|nr:efflux RND transporter periplasmic adaptor subunit [Pirellulales bacterium]